MELLPKKTNSLAFSERYILVNVPDFEIAFPSVCLSVRLSVCYACEV